MICNAPFPVRIYRVPVRNEDPMKPPTQQICCIECRIAYREEQVARPGVPRPIYVQAKRDLARLRAR